MKSTLCQDLKMGMSFALSLTHILSLFHQIPLDLTFMYASFLLSSINLWSIMKKPLIVQPHHTPSGSEMNSSAPEECWVIAVAAYPSTALVASDTCICTLIYIILP